MNIKSLFASTAMVLVNFGATAATYELGTLYVGDTYLAGSETSNLVVSGSFNDIFNFDIGSISDVGASAGTLSIKNFKITETTFSYSLFSSSNQLLGTGQNDNTSFTVASLAAGSYHLNISGTATGAKGGLYNGVLTVTAVPEPESYAMMLAGLGLMGAIARRRAKKDQA